VSVDELHGTYSALSTSSHRYNHHYPNSSCSRKPHTSGLTHVFAENRGFSGEVAVKAPPLYSFSAKRGEVEEVFVADLNLKGGLKPSRREWGHGLPGYSLGWFKLNNGAKAFCAVSSNVAVVFKLRDNKYLLITPSNITGFTSTLRELGWSITTQ